jgi:hypothetical protein
VTDWDIDPTGVQGVLNHTLGTAQEFDSATSSLTGALQGAASWSGSGLVSSALAGFVDSALPDIEFVYGRVQSAVGGCSSAVTAYYAGHEEMARNAQASATAAPSGSFGSGGPSGTGPR